MLLRSNATNKAETPASNLLVNSCDNSLSNFAKLVYSFKSFGLVTHGEIETFWPKISEVEVAKAISKNLYAGGEGIYLKVSNGFDQAGVLLNKYIDVDITADILLPKSDIVNLAKLHYRSWAMENKSSLLPNSKLIDVLKIYPKLLDSLTAEIADTKRFSYHRFIALRELITAHFNYAGKKDGYLAILWLAAEVKRFGSNVNNFINGSFTEIASEIPKQIIAKYNQRFTPSPEILETLGEISNEGRFAALLCLQVDKLVASNSDCFHRFKLNLSVLFSRSDSNQYVSQSNSLPPMQAVWQSLFSLNHTGQAPLSVTCNSMSSSIELQNRNQEIFSPHARYVRGRNAQVKVPSNSGDFSSIREFHSGDDIRRIDFRSSQRTGTLQVKLFEELESRPINLVCDLKWLLRKSMFNVRRAEEEIFNLLNNAFTLSFEVNLSLICITPLISELIRKNEFDSDKQSLCARIKNTLCSVAALLSAEESIFNSSQHGFHGIDLFSYSSSVLKKGFNNILITTEENSQATLSSLHVLRKRGYQISLIIKRTLITTEVKTRSPDPDSEDDIDEDHD